MSPTELVQLSNNLLYSSIAGYTVAMLAYTVEWSFGTRSKIGRAAAAIGSPEVAVRQPVPVTAGARSAGAGSRVGSGPGGGPVDLDGGLLGRPVADRRAEMAGGAPQRGSRADKVGRAAVAVTILAFVLQLASVALSAVALHRPPWGNMFEFSVAASLAMTGAYLGLLTRHDVRWLGLFVITPVLLSLGLAVTVLYVPNEQLVPALKSYWLAIHVSAAMISMGIFTVGGAVSSLFLVKDRAERRARTGGPGLSEFARRLPSADALDRLAYRLHAAVFPLWTFAIIAGAIWAENAWGKYWSWDPVETWAFITWVVYAGYLHARATAGWKGRRAAIISLVGLFALTFNYFVINIFIPGMHSYSGLTG